MIYLSRVLYSRDWNPSSKSPGRNRSNFIRVAKS